MADFGASEILPLLLESGAAAAPAAAGAAGAAAEAAPLFLGPAVSEAVPAAAAAAAPATASAGAALPSLESIWGGNTMGAGGAPSVMNLSGSPAVASDAAIANMGQGPDLWSGASMNQDWWDRNFGSGSWFDRQLPSKDAVTKALGSLGAAKNAMQKQTPAAPVMPGNLAAAQLGKGGGGTGLSTVLQLLQQRRQALLSSATAGPGGQARPSGLLGM